MRSPVCSAALRCQGWLIGRMATAYGKVASKDNRGSLTTVADLLL